MLLCVKHIIYSIGSSCLFLLRTVKSLRQLYTMTMDVHARYRTQSAADVVPRFNERFILSLAKCSNCLVCDDELNVLPVSRKTLQSFSSEQVEKGDAGEVIVRETSEDTELKNLKDSLIETPHVGVLVDLGLQNGIENWDFEGPVDVPKTL